MQVKITVGLVDHVVIMLEEPSIIWECTTCHTRSIAGNLLPKWVPFSQENVAAWHAAKDKMSSDDRARKANGLAVRPVKDIGVV